MRYLDDESDDEIQAMTVSKFGAPMMGSYDVSIDTPQSQEKRGLVTLRAMSCSGGMQ